jgi:uncharacterized membrane protein required for colicin V production
VTVEALYAGAAIVILYKAWRGWRLGVVRQIVSLGALLAGSLCGAFGAGPAGALLAPFLPLPERVLAAAGGLLLGMIVYFAINIVSAILFKKTADQGVALVRIGYGLTGGAVGAVYGAILVCALAIGVRLLGSVAEAKLALEKTPRVAQPTHPMADELALRLAGAKEVIDDSAIGSVARRIDPLPTTTYSMLPKLATLISNGRSIQRFLGEPGVREVMNHPKVVALLSDPEVSKALAEHRYFALLSNARFIAAADDPDVAARLAAIDFEKSLDHALQKPAAQAAPERTSRSRAGERLPNP